MSMHCHAGFGASDFSDASDCIMLLYTGSPGSVTLFINQPGNILCTTFGAEFVSYFRDTYVMAPITGPITRTFLQSSLQQALRLLGNQPASENKNKKKQAKSNGRSGAIPYCIIHILIQYFHAQIFHRLNLP
jgi:hypothetical protein